MRKWKIKEEEIKQKENKLSMKEAELNQRELILNKKEMDLLKKESELSKRPKQKIIIEKKPINSGANNSGNYGDKLNQISNNYLFFLSSKK